MLKRLVALLMMFLLLLTDSGWKLFAHTCLKSKHTHYSVYAPGHCCGEQKTDCSVEAAGCCDIKSALLKNKVDSELVSPLMYTDFNVFHTQVNFFLLSAFHENLNSLLPADSPPLSIKSCFRFTSVIRC